MKMPNEINYVPRERVLVAHVVVRREASMDDAYRRDQDYMGFATNEAASALAHLFKEHFTLVRTWRETDRLGLEKVSREYRIAVLPERDGRYFSAAVDEAFIAGMEEAARILDRLEHPAYDAVADDIRDEIDRRHRLIAAVLTTPVKEPRASSSPPVTPGQT